jgi:alpha-ribazole phosphatase/probable phosphoglycerate mutase
MTADLIAREQRRTVVIDARLQEIDFGDFEGRSYREIEHESPELFATWMATPTLMRFPNGEGFTDVRSRVSAAVTEIVARHEGETVALVTHGGVLRALLVQTLSMPDEAAFRLSQSYGALNVIEYLGDLPILRVMNTVVAGDGTCSSVLAALGIDSEGAS